MVLPSPVSWVPDVRALTKVIALNLHEKIDKAKNSHKIHHQNAAGLSYEFHISREAARQIVMSKFPNI